jgi:hypothetical protein
LSVSNSKGQEKDVLMKSAIFIQNRAGNEYNDKVEVLNDMLTSRLSDKFSIIDRKYVVSKFREYIDKGEDKRSSVDQSGEQMNIENSIADASALRIAQMIGADYLIIATINSVGKENRKFKGKGTIYKTDTEVTIYTLRVSIKVTEGNEGGTVYGDIVSASKKIPKLTNLEIESDDTINELLDQGSLKIAQNISDKISKIRNAKVVKFDIFENLKISIKNSTFVHADGEILTTSAKHINVQVLNKQVKFISKWV